MQLINALVTSPDDLDFRIHLRNEFLRCGLKKILPVSITFALSFHFYISILSYFLVLLLFDFFYEMF